MNLQDVVEEVAEAAGFISRTDMEAAAAEDVAAVRMHLESREPRLKKAIPAR